MEVSRYFIFNFFCETLNDYGSYDMAKLLLISEAYFQSFLKKIMIFMEN
jgi:hypothetical protein